MEKAFMLPVLLAFGTLHLAQAQQSTQSKPLVFIHVTAIDATGAPARPDMAVVIKGNRITELGPTRRVRVPKDAQVVDASGKFLIPGLWDMHVHWYGYDAEHRQVTARAEADARAAEGRRLPFHYSPAAGDDAL